MNYQITIGAELLAIGLLVIILIKMLLEKRTGTLSEKLFYTLIIISLVANGVDFLSWVLPKSAPWMIKGAVNYFAIVSPDIMIIPFAYYVRDCINETKHISRWVARIVLIAAAVNSFLSAIWMFTGLLFTFDNEGNFKTLVMYDYVGYLDFACMLYLFIITIVYRKELGKTETRSMLLYIIIPFVSEIAEFFIGTMEFSIAITSLSILAIYLFVQTEKLSTIEIREKILLDISYKDTLTEMKNRKAYDEMLKSVENDENVAVVFCDVNGLKYTNDNFGHQAGDKLLINFSKYMVNHLGYDNSFRISGDEFVSIFPKATKNDIAKKIEDFKFDLAANGRIASVGVSSGSGKDIIKILSDAEKLMYDAKKAFYEFEGKIYKR